MLLLRSPQLPTGVQGHIAGNGIVVKVPQFCSVQVFVPGIECIAVSRGVLRLGELFTVGNNLVWHVAAAVAQELNRAIRIQNDPYRVIRTLKGILAILGGHQAIHGLHFGHAALADNFQLERADHRFLGPLLAARKGQEIHVDHPATGTPSHFFPGDIGSGHDRAFHELEKGIIVFQLGLHGVHLTRSAAVRLGQGQAHGYGIAGSGGHFLGSIHRQAKIVAAAVICCKHLAG